MSCTRFGAFALAAATLAAGCGGSSKSGSLTSAELISKGDAICARVHAQYHANGYTTAASIAQLAPRLAGYEQTGVDEMRALKAPRSMASDWNTIVDKAQKVAEDTAKLGQYAQENKLKSATALFSADRQNQQRALAVAAHDGFKECSRAS